MNPPDRPEGESRGARYEGPPGADPAPPDLPAPEPKPRTRSAWRAAGWTLSGLASLLVLALLLAAAALVWVVQSPVGSAWLLGRLPGVTVAAPQGSLLGDFSAERLDIALPGAVGTDHIVIGGLRWRGLTVSRATSPAAWLRVEVDSLRADRVDVLITPDPAAPPLAPPRSLQWPIELDLRALDVAELHASTLGEQPLTGLQARLQIAADAGRTHRIEGLSLRWDRIAARGAARISSQSPFDVVADLVVESLPGAAAPAAFDASLAARGTLPRLELKATLRGSRSGSASGVKAPSLDLSATVLPFAAWPLGALQAQTRSLDLSALHSSAPGTSLDGTAVIESEASDRPAAVAIHLANARAGRIDEGLLPVRSVVADVQARPDDPRQVDIRALDLELGTMREAAGRLQGSGRWTPRHASLDATLANIAPRAIDSRAPAMRLGGRVQLTAEDWFDRSRDGAQPSLALRGRVDGSLPHGGRENRLVLDLDATATPTRLDLRQATLQASDSRATLTGNATQQARGDWHVVGKGSVAGFDPALWWPGADGSAWRKGPHRLNATLDLDGLVPELSGAARSVLQRLATARGQATLRINDSQLAGAPLAGAIALHGEGPAGLAVEGAVTLAGGKLALRGRLDPDGRDRWDLDLHATDLAQGKPLLQLAQPPGKAAPVLAGAIDGTAHFEGRWPQLASSGSLELKDSRLSNLHLAHAALRWTASTAAQAPLEVQAEMEEFGTDAQRADSLHLSVTGTAADHRIQLTAASPVRPPRWMDVLHGADTAPSAGSAIDPVTGTQAELLAQGALDFDPAWQQPLRWHGRLQQLEARRRGGKLVAPWFRVTAAQIDAQYDPLSRTPRVNVSPARAELPNLTLSWSQMRWQGGASPQIDLQAEVEPFAVAPLLARLQPDFGWGGDLVLAGHVNVHSTPGVALDIEFGRQQGDLRITDEAGTQALELTDLRLALEARDGVWNLTQALAGRTLGAMAAAATVRTDARAFWPPAEAPLQGVLEARVSDLAAWGAWAPAGWRLKGMLHAGASLGGHFGAPEYTGQITGSGLGVRNLVEGIDVHDGEVEIALKGDTAQIVKLQARAGDGSLQVSGGASFGAAPQARLRVMAEHMLLLGRVDRRIVASGDATLQLDPHSLQLDGRFTVDQGMIDFSRGNAPTLGNDVVVLREPANTPVADATARGPTVRDVKMNLVLNLGPALRLRGRGLDTRLQGELLITAPDGRLAINGTVNAVQGTYAAYGQRLAIERGVVTFTGAVANPRLDILALRPNLDIVVGVSVTGNANAPRISLYSEPDLPDNEKLSWLVLGRAPEGLPGSDTALLQAAAMALLAGEGDGPGSELARLNLLDTLSMRQSEGAVRSTILSVGKQLSQRWYIGYERSLSATAGNWQLIYRLAQRFTVRLQAGLDNSIDLIWSWRWE